MEQQKKKDMMSAAFDDFWTSDYKVPTHKFNTPRVKTAEDDAFDSFWGRGNYAPQPKIPSPMYGSKYVKNVNPVKYNTNVIQSRARLAQLQAELQRKQIEDKIAEINARRMSQNIQFAKKAASTGVNLARGATKSTVSGIKEAQKNVMTIFNKLKNKPEDESKTPVGLGGALHKSRIESGKESIYK